MDSKMTELRSCDREKSQRLLLREAEFSETAPGGPTSSYATGHRPQASRALQSSQMASLSISTAVYLRSCSVLLLIHGCVKRSSTTLNKLVACTMYSTADARIVPSRIYTNGK